MNKEFGAVKFSNPKNKRPEPYGIEDAIKSPYQVISVITSKYIHMLLPTRNVRICEDVIVLL